MGPIDPHQLLKALAPLLSQNGTIKGPTEAARIASLMKDATKMVSRCIYINILKCANTDDTMERFLSVGGWDTLNEWLQNCKEEENFPVLIELLKVYQNLPVSVDILKQNNAAKTIKQLTKGDNDQVKTLSSMIVDTWMKKVKKNNSSKDSSTSDAKVKKKKKDREKEGEKDRDRSEREKEKSDKHKHSKHHHHHSHSSRDKDSSSEKDKKEKKNSDDEDTDSSDRPSDDVATVRQGNGLKLHIKLGGDKSVDKSEKTETASVVADKPADQPEPTRKRPSTVKRPQTKFRSTGFEESILPAKKKATSDSSSSSPSSAGMFLKPAPKRSGSELKSDAPEKKSRLHIDMPAPSLPSLPSPSVSSPVSTSPVSPSEVHGKIKIIPPRPNTREIQESSGFMDDLTRTSGRTYGAYKRKKKAAAAAAAAAQNNGSKSPTTPTTPVSPNTAIAKSLPSVPSFYKDTLQDPEPSPEKAVDAKKERSPSPTDDMVATEEADNKDIKDIKVEPKDATVKTEQSEKVKSEPEEADSEHPAQVKKESSTDSNDPNESKGLLTTGTTTKKKPRKSVTWAEESRIREIFYFELDETERENVNRSRDFNQAKKKEMLMDRKVMESAKRLINDNMVEQIPWYRPIPLANATVVVEAGRDSLEKNIQKERELGVLQALFFNKNMLPDAPAEPELELEDASEPKLIPLEDSSGGEEYMYNYEEHPKAVVNQPPPVTGPPPDLQTLQQHLPPDVAGILGTLQNSQPDSQVLANVHNMLQSIMHGGGEQSYDQIQQMLLAGNPMSMPPPGPPPDAMMHQGPPPGHMPGPPPPGPAGPPMGPRTGLLGQAPPGFLPQRPMGPPRFGPPGPGPGPGGPPPGENWGDNMGGGPMRPGRGHPRPGFRGRMPGPGGPPPRGRGGRRISRTVCRHFKANGCLRGSQCGFLHPVDQSKGNDGPATQGKSPPHDGPPPHH